MRSMRMEIPERLSDDAVSLRPLRTDDARPYAAFRADPELGWLAGYEDDPDEDWVRKRAEEQPTSAEEGKGLDLAIADPGTGDFWGSMILHGFDGRTAAARSASGSCLRFGGAESAPARPPSLCRGHSRIWICCASR